MRLFLLSETLTSGTGKLRPQGLLKVPLAPCRPIVRTVAITICLLAACRSERVVSFDFAANLSLGELKYERSLIDLGTGAARRELLGGWSIDERADGMTYVWSDRETSELGFFIVRPRPLTISFRCASFGPREHQAITVSLNEQYVDLVTLQQGWQEYQLSLPANALKVGINRLEFEYAYTWVPAELNPASTDRRRLAVLWDRFRFDDPMTVDTSNLSAKSGVLKLPLGARLDYYIRIPEHSYLAFESLDLPVDADASLIVEFETDEMSARRLGSFNTSQGRQSLALGNPSPLIARVSFLASSGSADQVSEPWIELEKPILEPASQSLPNQDGSSRRRLTFSRPPILLYLIDALRSDHLQCYGYERGTSPNIDRFAEDGVLFLRHVAQSPWTKASVASLFTGLNIIVFTSTGPPPLPVISFLSASPRSLAIMLAFRRSAAAPANFCVRMISSIRVVTPRKPSRSR